MKARIFPRLMGHIGLATLVFFMVAGSRVIGAQDINYRLKWILNTSVVGDLAADINGHFKAAGLKVTVKPGGLSGTLSRNSSWGSPNLEWHRPTR